MTSGDRSKDERVHIREIADYTVDGKRYVTSRYVSLADYQALLQRLRQINTLACYASEENTAARADALLEIGKLARGEETKEWPSI